MRILHSQKIVFVSKPRCGSTSVRRFLTSRMEEGDIAVDVPDHTLGLHPHMSSPAIHAWMRVRGFDPAEYYTFTVIRNPIEMLWSYYNYFRPDRNSNYTFSPGYDESSPMEFAHWLSEGKVGIGAYWSNFVPAFVQAGNLSPLSLEAHACDREGRMCLDGVFRIEDTERLGSFLSGTLRMEGDLPVRNKSRHASLPDITSDIVDHVLRQFPLETALYDLRHASR